MCVGLLQREMKVLLKLHHYRIAFRMPCGLLLLLVSLISGCTSLWPGASRQASGMQHQRYPNSMAPYNKPYKVGGITYYPMSSAAGYREVGVASWYGPESGNRTAMGMRFAPHGLTAAHKTLPLPTKVRVTNLSNGRSVEVMVNDRGPFKKGRIIDLSHGAAREIGMNGVTRVRVEHIEDKAGRHDK